jgi:micrococcal nuclease
LYTYSAKVIGCHDGDTIKVQVDLGFSVYMQLVVRLARIDAPEIFGLTKAMGIEAKDYLINKLLDKAVTIKTFRDKKEKYGRYLADVYVNDICINDELVETGHAVYKDY